MSAGSLGTLKTEIVRTFAALNATNEAILYAKSPEELYRKVSEAACFSGDFLGSAVFLLEPGTDLLRFAAGCGDDIARLHAEQLIEGNFNVPKIDDELDFGDLHLF